MTARLTISDRIIALDQPPYLIAEIGSNHNQSEQVARDLIDAAREAGCDAVKFQTFKGTDIPNRNLPADAYGRFDWNRKFNYWHEVLDSLAMPYEWYPALIEYASSSGLHVIATPESTGAADFLQSQSINALKLASMDLTFIPLLEYVDNIDLPILISTGMSHREEIDTALRAMPGHTADNLGILHCISNYPATCKSSRMDIFSDLATQYSGYITGLSDHSEHNYAVAVACHRGACIIEKHITMNKKSKGPDHAFALEPQQLKEMVRAARCGFEMRQGEGSREARPDLNKNAIYRRSVHFTRGINAGSIIEHSDLKCVRPGTGIPPADLDRIIGRKLKCNAVAEEPARWDMFV